MFSRFRSLFSLGATQAFPIGTIDKLEDKFTPDEVLQANAAEIANKIIVHVKDKFEKTLDWSDDSIRVVEEILGTIYKTHPEWLGDFKVGKLSPLQTTYSMGFGFYVGEVYRKNHGGVWGHLEIEGHKLPTVHTVSGSNIFPTHKTYKRLLHGPEDNVFSFYKIAIEIIQKEKIEQNAIK